MLPSQLLRRPLACPASNKSLRIARLGLPLPLRATAPNELDERRRRLVRAFTRRARVQSEARRASREVGAACEFPFRLFDAIATGGETRRKGSLSRCVGRGFGGYPVVFGRVI